MTWTAPPTFTDGQVLSATQLNALSDNCEYLYGLSTMPNVPFSTLLSDSDLSESSENNVWYVRHKFQYLHYRFEWPSTDPSDLRIYYNYGGGGDFDNPVYDPSSFSSPHAGYVDLYAELTVNPTVGTWYPIHIRAADVSVSFTVCYLIESNSTSLLPS